MSFFKSRTVGTEEVKMQSLLESAQHYFSNKATPERLRKYATRLHDKGVTADSLATALTWFIDNADFFPRFNELIDKLNIAHQDSSSEFRDCSICNSSGVLYLRFTPEDKLFDFNYNHAYRCKCDRGESLFPGYPSFREYLDKRDKIQMDTIQGRKHD